MASIGDLMAHELITVAPTATTADAAKVLTANRVSSVIVMENDEPVGIFTERDIVRALADRSDAGDSPVTEWMTRDPTSVPVSTNISQALQIMLDGGYRHLPITDEGRMVGIVSMRDISRWLGSA